MDNIQVIPPNNWDDKEKILETFLDSFSDRNTITWEIFDAKWKELKKSVRQNNQTVADIPPYPRLYFQLEYITVEDLKFFYLTFISEFQELNLNHDVETSLEKLIKQVLGEDTGYVKNKKQDLKEGLILAKEKLKSVTLYTSQNFTQGRRRKPGSAKRKKKLGKKHNSRKKKQKKRESKNRTL